MIRQKIFQVFFNTDGAHTRTTTAMRNTEGFVQVKVRYVRAYVTWRGHANLSVHVGTVHVDLAAVAVD